MYSSIFTFISQIHPVSQELKQAISACLSKHELRRKTILLKEGKVCDRVYFIERGLARAFYFLEAQEITSWFMKENDLIISVYSFFSQKPSYEHIVLLEDAILISITYQDLDKLYGQFPEFNYFGRVLTQKYYVRSEERVLSYQMQSSKQRYDALLATNPQLFNRTQKKHIASYLGMSPETLSRLRATK